MAAMGMSFRGLLGASLLLFGVFSSSSHYSLNSYSVGPGGTNNAASSTYTSQSNAGETAGGTASSTTYTSNNGSVQTEQLNVPLAPTVSNGSNTYYNQLQVTLNTGILPSDTTYAIAISSNNFATTNYVQTGGTLSGTAFYQSYTAWGGSSGSYIVGLSPSTTYEVKVAAKEGLFTNTEFGPYASASTVSPSITFSLSPNTLTLSNLLAGSVVTSGNVTFNLTTNAASGGNIFTAGQYGGLHSASRSYTIAALTGNLSTSTHGFGLQGVSTSQTSGGPLSIDSPYNGTGNNVGTESTTYAPVFTSSAAISGGTGTLDMQAKASSTDPASTDYQEILTFVASASF
jgi:hypothetical protein